MKNKTVVERDKIQIDLIKLASGDMTKLLGLQQAAATADPVAQEVVIKIREITE